MKQNERRKKSKYLEACLEWIQHFKPLVLSVESVVVEDKKAATKQLTDAFYNTWDRAYLATCGYVRAHLYLNLVWAFSILVQGLKRVRTQNTRQMPEDGVSASRLVIRGY